MPEHHYSDVILRELSRCIRGLFTTGISLTLATRDEDVRGVDLHYKVDHALDLQVRCRFDRPAYASDSDVTFRDTEPAMIAAQTYAPVALFAWFSHERIVAAKLIDIYRMAAKITPPLRERIAYPNRDGGHGFHVVEIGELHNARALLKMFDGSNWNTPILGGEARLNQILAASRKRREPVY